MNTIYLKAYAKINLALDVLRRRPDGYHEVRMIMQSVRLHDRLRITRTRTPGIRLRTNLDFLPTNENNLVYAAANLFFEQFPQDHGVNIQLDKRIPVSAGMAGGSTDAAAALFGLNRLFQTGLSLSELQKLGVKLGADVPYCLLRGTALSEGIGEILTPLAPAPSCHVLLVKPPVSISTKHVYEHLNLDETTLHPDIDGMIDAIHRKSLPDTAALLSNVLESVTRREYPAIADIEDTMREFGALNALMSGSGPTVFGLFSDRRRAEKAFYHFKTGSCGRQTFLTAFFQPAISDIHHK